MSIFLTQSEKEQLDCCRIKYPAIQGMFWGLRNRAEARTENVLGQGGDTDTPWWYHVAEYLSDAAMAQRLKPSCVLENWLHSTTLAIVRRPIEDWEGPSFRKHREEANLGHLETAHLGWGVTLVLDLVPELFTSAELEEIKDALSTKCIPLCLQWLDENTLANNWHSILTAGLALPAVVLGDQSAIERSCQEFLLGLDLFQEDGSYGESLQYGNYAAYAMALTWEALVRYSPGMADTLPLKPYAHMVNWQAASLFYRKPLTKWGQNSMARSANFGDSAAVFRPSADLLLHIASRAAQLMPKQAGLARWLFDSLYTPFVEQGPHDRATFGLVNDYGFLSFSLIGQAVDALTPEEAGLKSMSAFSCGDMIARDAWGGRTILAVHGAGETLNTLNHTHADLNSFILVHNRERMLVDPGHMCYRTLTQRVLNTSSLCHNTCSFYDPEMGDRYNRYFPSVEQNIHAKRWKDESGSGWRPKIDRGGQRLLFGQIDDVRAMGSDIGGVYEDSIRSFRRFWFLCGSHVLFVVDHIESPKPLKTTWNWMLNNRDNALQLKILQPDRIIARRGEAGMKLIHVGGNEVKGPTYAQVHDAYHPLPNLQSDGAAGSGLLINWSESTPQSERTVVHAICMDHYGTVADWHFEQADKLTAVFEGPDGTERWVMIQDDCGLKFTLKESISGRSYAVNQFGEATWALAKT